jgi:hypothetical protein
MAWRGSGVRIPSAPPSYCRSKAAGGPSSWVPSGLCARRRAGHMACVRSSGHSQTRVLSRPGPTTDRAAPRRSRWPGCSSWRHPCPVRGPPASRCTPGRSRCPGSRQPPLLAPARDRGTDHDRQVVHGCDAWTDHAFRVAKRAIKIRNESGWLAAEGACCDRDQDGTHRTDGQDRVFELAERRRRSSKQTAPRAIRQIRHPQLLIRHAT